MTAPTQTAGMDELTDCLAELVRHLLSSTGRDMFEAIDALGLSFTQIKAAQLLAEADQPLSLGAIGDRLGLSLPAVSRAVDGLVKRGLCTREEDPVDRRCKRLVITKPGRRLYERIYAIRVAGVRAFVEQLEPEQREALLSALRPIAKELP
jgi:DNA-binding MarR family transcriptional regulator